MSKITIDGLTRSDTGCFIAVPIRQQCMGVKGLMDIRIEHWRPFVRHTRLLKIRTDPKYFGTSFRF